MRTLIFFIAVAILISLPALSACSGSDGEAPGTAANGATQAAVTSSDDRMALLAAETILRNAENSQENYFRHHGIYASSTEKLRNANEKISNRLEVVWGDTRGYEMRVVAGDAAHTTLILKKQGTRIERVDSNGNPW
jgi:hypothetical protein